MVKNFLQWAAIDIVSILTNSLQTAILSLKAGDNINNTILDLAKILKRADKILQLNDIYNTPLPRVIKDNISKKSVIPNKLPNIVLFKDDEIITQSLRVSQNISNYITIDVLHTLNSLAKNSRFKNIVDYHYNLRSKYDRIIQNIYGNPTDKTILQYIFNPYYSLNHIYREDGKKKIIDSLLVDQNKDVWNCSLSNEWGWLVQDNTWGIKGTDTIVFIPKSQVSTDKKVTYATMVCDYYLLKDKSIGYK